MTKQEFERLMLVLDSLLEVGSKEMLANVIDGVNRDRYHIIRTYADVSTNKSLIDKQEE
ncbi:hypothetical protein RYX56_01615 [Alkalihalophilus lindianensis]|uniref:Uncharacterized protein n=1 Tax=Alkalihalophilus lindianensis TaxID=1630542 RepID=A0ABU3X587_9BACI|nr:hypothetical protein [Alkalihalophilus lindianensis]MDV2683066.1 hypothetical protein [Alkalihalophilus lindianensis]